MVPLATSQSLIALPDVEASVLPSGLKTRASTPAGSLTVWVLLPVPTSHNWIDLYLLLSKASVLPSGLKAMDTISVLPPENDAPFRLLATSHSCATPPVVAGRSTRPG